jgi:ABC-type dipeptide/oligopeptide/nickel transport system permease component
MNTDADMLRFLLRRLLLLVPVLVGLTLLVFAIARLLPGDPVALAAGPNASPAEITDVAREFGLDQPVYVQYWTYATGLLQGDWGRSIFTRRQVLDDLKVYLPATLELIGAAMLLAVAIGIPVGLMAGVHRDRWPDYVSRAVSLGAISMPRFFLGLLLQLGFAMWLGWLPLSGRFPIADDPPALVTGFPHHRQPPRRRPASLRDRAQSSGAPGFRHVPVAARDHHAHDAGLHHRGSRPRLRADGSGRSGCRSGSSSSSTWPATPSRRR